MSSRHSPSPSPQVPLGMQPAGVHPAFANTPAPPVTANFLPNSANQADMQHVLNLVKELSDLQASNRQRTTRLIENIHVVGNRESRRHAAAPGGPEEPGAEQPIDPELRRQLWAMNHASLHYTIEHERMRDDLAEVTLQRNKLRKHCDDAAEMAQQFEDTLESIMVRVREFADQHTTSLIRWHNHYNGIVQRERDANYRLRCEHSRWQEAVGRLGDNVRSAYDAQNTLLLPYERKIAGLKRENRILKRRCGLDLEHSDDELELPTTENGRKQGPGISGYGHLPPRSMGRPAQ